MSRLANIRPFFVAVLSLSISLPALGAAPDVFHGWSKDASWLVYESTQRDDRTALFFCKTDKESAPSWPAELNDMELLNDRLPECVRFIDANKAPYLWKKALLLPEAALRSGKFSVKAELIQDSETPGLVIEGPGGTQACYVSALKETSVLEKTWWHPSNRAVAALVDGRFSNCLLSQPPAAPKARLPKAKAPKSIAPRATRKK
jgi:hypothetical protein